MTRPCDDCAEAARTWHWGGYRANCRGCMVRSVASAPEVIRGHFYAQLPEAERAAFVRNVGDEIARVGELRMRRTAGEVGA